LHPFDPTSLLDRHDVVGSRLAETLDAEVTISRVSCWWLSLLLSFAGSTDTLSPALQAVARAYFNDRGLLKSSRLQDFGKLMDELRKADDQAVVYGDVLNYVDRQMKLPKGGRQRRSR
jgi:hypothetical protein